MPTRKDTRLTGQPTLAYVGVEAVAPPLLLTVDRAPATNDYKNYNIGTIWVDRSTTPKHDVWMLVNKDAKIATWIKISLFANVILSVPCDTGTAIPNAAGELNLLGDTIITTAGAGSTATISLSDGTNGQLLIGGGGAGAVWGDLTSTGGSITVSTGVNTLNLEVTGAVLQIDGDSGSATPAAGVITVAGGTNLTTVAAVSTVTVNMDNDVSLTGFLDAATYVEGGNLRMTANTLSSQDTNGDINLIPDGTGDIVMNNGAADTFIMLSTGERTMPLQPAFSAENTTLRSNVTGDNTEYDLIFNSEIFDQGGDYDHTTGIFTAPITGKYAFSYGYSLADVAVGHTQSFAVLNGASIGVAEPQTHLNPFNQTDGSSGTFTIFIGTYFVELTASDTIYVSIQIAGGTKTIDVVASNTYFMGWLVL